MSLPLFFLLGVVSRGCFLVSGDSIASTSLPWRSESGLAEVAVGLEWGSRVSLLNDGDLRETVKLVKMAAQEGLLLTAFTWRQFDDGTESTFPVTYWSRSKVNLPNFFQALRELRYPTERLLLLTDYPVDSEVQESFKSLNVSRAFFVHQLGSSSATIIRMQSFRNHDILVMNKWDRTTDRHFNRFYDFQGAPMTLLATYNDFPWVYFVPCPHQPTIACNFSGGDISILDVLTKMFNFTVEIHFQKDGNWGTLPVTGKVGELMKALRLQSRNHPSQNDRRCKCYLLWNLWGDSK